MSWVGSDGLAINYITIPSLSDHTDIGSNETCERTRLLKTVVLLKSRSQQQWVSCHSFNMQSCVTQIFAQISEEKNLQGSDTMKYSKLYVGNENSLSTQGSVPGSPRASGLCVLRSLTRQWAFPTRSPVTSLGTWLLPQVSHPGKAERHRRGNGQGGARNKEHWSGEREVPKEELKLCCCT